MNSADRINLQGKKVMENFDREDIYDNEISPLINKIISVCKKHAIPMIATFTYANCDEKGTGRCTSLVNNIDNRHDRALTEALKEVSSGGREAFAFAVTSGNHEEENS